MVSTKRPSAGARVAFASCNEMPEPDRDEGLLEQCAKKAGLDATTVGWNQEGVDWSEYDLVIVRSTWDYHHDPEKFTEWMEEVAERSRIYNPVDVMRDNIHKGYLTKLPDRDVPTIPTRIVERGTPFRVDTLTGLGDVVLKPATSAGSYLTGRFNIVDQEALMAHAGEILATRDLMIQPYMPSVEHPGERSAVWIDGAFTHVIRKSPRFGSDAESVTIDAPLTKAETHIAERALLPYQRDLLYARVDLIQDDAGAPLVAELELVEPSLFLSEHPPALTRLLEGIRRRLP